MYEGAVQDLIDELGRLPGIGPKTAKLNVVQLAGKIIAPRASGAARAAATPDVAASVTQALMGLGWNERAAAEAVSIVMEDAVTGNDSVAKYLAGQIGRKVEERDRPLFADFLKALKARLDAGTPNG